jgi:hypothetical protein
MALLTAFLTLTVVEAESVPPLDVGFTAELIAFLITGSFAGAVFDTVVAPPLLLFAGPAAVGVFSSDVEFTTTEGSTDGFAFTLLLEALLLDIDYPFVCKRNGMFDHKKN